MGFSFSGHSPAVLINSFKFENWFYENQRD